jgi:hypothetical protein
VAVLVDWDMDVIVDVLDLWNLNGLLHLLHHWHLPLLRDWYIDNLINVLDLWNLLRLLHNLWHRDLLCHDLRHLGDVLLNDRLLALDCLLDDLWLLDLNSLNLVLRGAVNHGVNDLRHLNDLLRDSDLRNFDRFLHDLRLWHLDNKLD